MKDNNSINNKLIVRSVPAVGSLGLFTLGLMFSPIIAIGTTTLWGLGVIAFLSCGEYLLSFLYRSDLDRFFEDANIVSKSGKLPTIVTKKKISETCMEYRLRLPAGMSTDDLNKLKPSMEQYLDASITINYKNGQSIIVANKEKLKTHYEFELVQTENPLEIMFGYDLHGKIFVNIEDAPHLLIAGQTGSGKSVCLRSLITSILLLKQDTVELSLVDFMRVEQSIFKDCKGVTNFCTSPIEFAQLLIELKKESDKRLNKFEECGVVNISAYNNKNKSKSLKYKLIVIDEFATLAEKQFKYILDSLTVCIAQFRKTGIHFIIATQRCSVDIITGSIKSNIPYRIAFKTSDGTNSRIILDNLGAEELSCRGRGILLTNEMREFQGMYLSEEDAFRLVQPLITLNKNQNKKGVKNNNGTIPKQQRLPNTTPY